MQSTLQDSCAEAGTVERMPSGRRHTLHRGNPLSCPLLNRERPLDEEATYCSVLQEDQSARNHGDIPSTSWDDTG